MEWITFKASFVLGIKFKQVLALQPSFFKFDPSLFCGLCCFLSVSCLFFYLFISYVFFRMYCNVNLSFLEIYIKWAFFVAFWLSQGLNEMHTQIENECYDFEEIISRESISICWSWPMLIMASDTWSFQMLFSPL